MIKDARADVRADIQLLRGVAVLSVLLFHAKIGPFANGYLGVDVFFVVSGYLMTAQILRGLNAGRFSFTAFYVRRARRLLPALYSTLAVSTALAYLVLTDRQWSDYLAQLFGALTFSANLVLPFQVGYFEDAADSRPLLHIWSLSLEEQYYLLLPLLLFLVVGKRRAPLPLLAALALSSLVLYLVAHLAAISSREILQISASQWAFFLLPTRAWELLTGSVIASLHVSATRLTIAPWFARFCLAALVVLLAYPQGPSFGTANPVIAVLLTAVLLAMKDDRWLSAVPMTGPVRRVGDWSYSVYLVHWPLMSFAFIAYLGQVPLHISAALLLVSLALGAAQYRYVEQRFRYARADSGSWRILAGLSAATLALVAMTAPIQMRLAEIEASAIADSGAFRKNNLGLDWRCSLGDLSQVEAHCRSGDTPQLAVWGDSYAMHLVPGLLNNPLASHGLVQLTKPTCNPALGLTGIISGNLGAAQDCIAFNDQAFGYLLSSQSIRHVVLSSPFGYFYNGPDRYLFGGEIVDRHPPLAVQALVETLKRLQEAGKVVTIVSPPPTDGRDIGECLERELAGKLLLGRRDCSIDASIARARGQAVTDALRQVGELTGARVIWLWDRLCDEEVCATRLGDVPIYRDMGHLSIPGSKALLSSAILQ